MLLLVPTGGCPPGGGTATSDDDTSGTGDPAAGTVCERHVACLGVIDSAAQKAADAEVGSHGACWTEPLASQEACVAACIHDLDAAHQAHADVVTCDAPSPPDDAILEIGVALFDPNEPLAEPSFGPLAPGDPLTMVRGGQGLLMFPIALRGARFPIADDPLDYDDPKMPQVDLWLDIDGFNIGFGDHFARVYNYPIPFRPLTADSVQFLYIAIIVPDEISDPKALEGKAAHLWLEFFPYEEASLVRELDLTIVVPDAAL
ncbi:MAG: hypothetical protein R3B09_04485 [Nannocystaceae bacterium]